MNSTNESALVDLMCELIDIDSDKELQQVIVENADLIFSSGPVKLNQTERLRSGYKSSIHDIEVAKKNVLSLLSGNDRRQQARVVEMARLLSVCNRGKNIEEAFRLRRLSSNIQYAISLSKVLRGGDGYTQGKLAQNIGVSEATMSSFWNGGRNRVDGHLDAITNHLGLRDIGLSSQDLELDHQDFKSKVHEFLQKPSNRLDALLNKTSFVYFNMQVTRPSVSPLIFPTSQSEIGDTSDDLDEKRSHSVYTYRLEDGQELWVPISIELPFDGSLSVVAKNEDGQYYTLDTHLELTGRMFKEGKMTALPRDLLIRRTGYSEFWFLAADENPFWQPEDEKDWNGLSENGRRQMTDDNRVLPELPTWAKQIDDTRRNNFRLAHSEINDLINDFESRRNRRLQKIAIHSIHQ